jgi:hypothetical protein
VLLRVPLDEVEPRQVNARERLVFDVPFFELLLREPQMKNLQAVLHLEKFTSQNKNEIIQR